MAEEQKYISKYRRGFSREKILEELLKSGEGRARRAQGWPNLTTHNEPLLAVGDKCGWDAVNEYRKRNASVDLIEEFGRYMEMPIKTIVTLRHPLDNISAWVVSPKYKRIYKDDDFRFQKMVSRYVKFHNAAWEMLENTDYFLLHNEELIKEPSGTLQEMSDFLGLPPNRDWRRATAKRIWNKPHQRRDEFPWPERYMERVKIFIESSPLLGYYI
jgi:hypothetical protein